MNFKTIFHSKLVAALACSGILFLVEISVSTFLSLKWKSEYASTRCRCNFPQQVFTFFLPWECKSIRGRYASSPTR